MTTPMTDFEDGALINMILAGHADCFMVLMNRHLVALRRCIGAIVRNTSDAEDLLQDVLLKVWVHLSTFRSESSFRTWVTRVAVNEALMSYRCVRRMRFSQEPAVLDAIPSPGEPPDRTLARKETALTVRRAVAGLPPIYRQALILCDLEQLSTRETAKRLHLTLPAVKTRLFRGRLMLLAVLRRTKTPGSMSPVTMKTSALASEFQ